MVAKHKQYKSFDLTKQRPQVLLLGNGLSRQKSWHDFIKSVADKNVEKYSKNEEFLLPNLILTSAVTDIKKDSERQNQYLKAFENYKYNDCLALNKLLSSNFDAILTTNYTYEIEYAIDKNYCDLTDNTKRDKYAKSTEEKYDDKYLIHTFNRLCNNGFANDIWHIHGEQRRKSSLILTHDEYARLIGKIIDHNKSVGNRYEHYYNNFKFKSWIDYAIMGDLYIVGQGFDYFEFDLWWLLLRRLREKAETGTVYFYEPEKSDNKYKLLALNDLDIKTLSLNCKIDDSISLNEQYTDFYSKAIGNIALQVSKNRKEL